MGSSRLPGKVLADLGGRMVIDHVLARARRIAGVAETVLAIPDTPEDDPLEVAAARHQVPVVRGHATDVLDRYYVAARARHADAIVRLTADCPLLDPRVSAQVVERFADGGVDYVSNIHPATYPDGFDTEILTWQSLATAWRDAKDPFEREHVTPFIWRRPQRFRVANVADSNDRSSWRLTIDTASDLEALRCLAARLDDADRAGISEIAAVVARHPQLVRRTS